MSFIATLLARWIGEKWAGIVADALPFIAVAALVWWVQGMRSTIDEQAGRISVLTVALDTEKQARQRDVAGLTLLAKGQAKVAAQSQQDQKILSETVNASNPTPASSGLAALLDGLRRADQQHAAPAR